VVGAVALDAGDAVVGADGADAADVATGPCGALAALPVLELAPLALVASGEVGIAADAGFSESAAPGAGFDAGTLADPLAGAAALADTAGTAAA
jgi:hypothetical protein